MSEQLSMPLVRPLEDPPLVRLRCTTCDVAWSGSPESPCWVCGEPGAGLRSIVRYREREINDFEFEY